MQITLRQAIAPHQALANNLLVVMDLLDTIRGSITCADIDLDDEIPETHAAILWAYAYILSCGVLTERPLLSLFAVYRRELLHHADLWVKHLSREPDANLTPLLLSVANREMASLSNSIGWWYDLRNARRTHDRPVVFEGISYNLAYPVKLEWCRLMQARAEANL